MAFHPEEGLVFIPALSTGALAQVYADADVFAYRKTGWNTGISFQLGNLPNDEAMLKGLKAMLKGQLIAWDPVKQEARWTVEHPYFWNAGVLATAGGLVFQGAAEGKFRAYSAKDGKELWSYDTGNGVVAAPSTFEVAGEQYVALMVGYGGAGPLSAAAFLPDRPRLPGRLMVFKLGGKATAPAHDIPERLPIDLTNVSSVADAKTGQQHFNDHCLVCHGANASGAYLPDLKRSLILRDAGSWASVVLDGSLAQNGMVSFKDYLSAEQAEAIRAYVISEARLQLQRDQAAAAGAVQSGG
jgi:mono/diheme cytochrome c family protein